MSEAWTKISGRLFNIHLKLLRLGPGSMDRTRRQVSIFRKSDSPDDLERVSTGSLGRLGVASMVPDPCQRSRSPLTPPRLRHGRQTLIRHQQGSEQDE
jgi:hypothetical protein